MRVALLTNFVPPYRLPLLRRLEANVSALRVFASTPMESNRGYWKPEAAGLGVVVQKTLTLKRTWRHERFQEPYELHVPYDTIPQLIRFRPDVIITAEFGLRTIQALLYGQLRRVPVIVWATLADHLEESRGRARRVLRSVLAPRAAGFFVNGEAGARYLRSIGVADGLIHRLPQAIDVEPYLAIPLERPDRFQRALLFCGAISELKGADLLIAAAAAWGKRYPALQLSLTMLGDGPLRESLQRIRLPANVIVRWPGAVPYEQLPHWYAQHGVLIFPTRGDEWGLVVNEALAAGMPVIGSEYSQAVDEMIVEGGNGWRFRPDDSDALVRALERGLMISDDNLAQMRAEARASVARLTPDAMAGRMTEVLKEICKQNVSTQD